MMKNLLITIAFSLLFVFSQAQVSEKIYPIAITSGAVTAAASVPVDADITLIEITVASINTDWTIAPAGSPSYNQSFDIIYRGGSVEFATHNVTIFGVTLDTIQKNDTVYLKTFYDGSDWYTFLLPSFGSQGVVTPGSIHWTNLDSTTLELNTSNKIQIMDEGVTLAKLEDIADGKVIVGNVSDRPAEITLSGDITMTNAGVTAITDDSVTTSSIADEAVTTAKMADLARGSILVGNSTARPAAVDATTSGQVLVGDGTDLNSVALSGVLTLTSAGVTDLAASSVETADIVDGDVTLAKLETLAAGQVIVANASGVPTAVTMSGDITVNSSGVASIAAGAVTATELDADINTSLITKSASESTGHDDGVVAFHLVASTQFKALLTGSQATVFTLENGGMILDVQVIVHTAAGTPCTMGIGINSATYPAYVDDDGIAATIDLNAAGKYLASDPTYSGVLLDEGPWTNDSGAPLYISITPSVDASATALVGTILVTYVPNN